MNGIWVLLSRQQGLKRLYRKERDGKSAAGVVVVMGGFVVWGEQEWM